MYDNASYYIALLALIVIGIVVAKKIASCLIKTIIIVVLSVIGAYIYYQYLQ